MTAPLFVGRSRELNRLSEAVAGARAGRSGVALITGAAGMGKSALVAHALDDLRPQTVWGTCWGDAPGYWPWSQALGKLAAVGRVDASVDDIALLARVVPALGVAAEQTDPTRDRLLTFDAVARWLTRLAATDPLVVVLDDLQWADRSSLDLLDFLARAVHGAGILFVGTARDDELPAWSRATVAGLASRGEHLALSGLEALEVHRLVAELAGDAAADQWAPSVHRRAGGQPFFVRELAVALAEGTGDVLPTAVRDSVIARLDRLDVQCREVLRSAALMGNEVRVDLLAVVTALEPADVTTILEQASAAGVLAAGRFSHDLVRETLVAEQPRSERTARHLRIAAAMAATRSPVTPAAEVARHFAEAIGLDGCERAVAWAQRAAEADRGRLALTEAAGHLRMVRERSAGAGVPLPSSVHVELLVEEADALSRAGDPEEARALLELARPLASEAAHVAAIAFGVQALGARFAMPRTHVIELLEQARVSAAGQDDLEARLTAALARELAHSIPEHRSKADPLSLQALDLAREPAARLACLRARHDVIWTPGTSQERQELARQVVALAEELGDVEQRSEGLLLVANAQLEQGAAAFRDTLRAWSQVLEVLNQPRHRYQLVTRSAALALLDGDLDAAERLIEDAAALGERIREPDTGNVRMSQRLSLVQQRNNPAELRSFADEAVRWWVGAPVHAHAVAAGFLSRAGDLDAARRELAVVAQLGGWRADTSYLWSVFIGQLAVAAVAVGDLELCEDVLVGLRPVVGSCGVNGAVVAFAGSLAEPAGAVAEALGHTEEARALFGQADQVHARLGARGMGLGRTSASRAVLRRVGTTWSVTVGSRAASFPDSKGLGDLSVLLSQPGVDVHVLQLTGAGLVQGAAGQLADRTAIASYRRRLLELDEDEAIASDQHDLGRAAQLAAERDALLAELGSVTSHGGRPRSASGATAERARKAVSARIREATARMAVEMPEAAASLDRSVITGTWCRYRPDPQLSWTVET